MARINYDKDLRATFPLECRKKFETINLLEGCYFECPRSWTVYNLRYNYHRMYYIMGGEAYYERGGEAIALKKGCLYIFPSQSIRYRIFHNPDKPLHVLWCHFEMVPDISNDIIEVDVEREAQFKDLIELWYKIAFLPAPGNEMYHAVLLILYAMDRLGKFVYMDQYFDGLQQYILDHISDKLSVSGLAEEFGYERSYFARKFGEIYNLTPSEYLRSIRLNRAANLLVCGLSIDEICKAIGYADKKAFSRAFKAYFNVSPTEYLISHKLQP